METKLVESWGTDLTVVNAARVSFDKESEWEEHTTYDGPEARALEEQGYINLYSDDMSGYTLGKLSDKDCKLISYLAKHKHTSCFEHQGATLRLKVPIFIARQIQRHRTFSYNEISRRYVDSPPEFYWPDKWRKRADNVKQGSSDEEMPAIWNDSMRRTVGAAYHMYEAALEAGMAPELARIILPQSMYTEFYMTGNLRSWDHFLQLRLDSHAQKEVQDIAMQVQDILTPLWPISMKALKQQAA